MDTLVVQQPPALQLVIQTPAQFVSQISVGQGPAGVDGSQSDLNYLFNQAIATDVWVVQHNLGKYPSVTIIDSAGDQCEGRLVFVDENTLRLEFTGSFAGIAYLN